MRGRFSILQLPPHSPPQRPPNQHSSGIWPSCLPPAASRTFKKPRKMQVPGPRPPKMSLFGRLGGLSGRPGGLLSRLGGLLGRLGGLLGRLGGLLGCLGGHLGADLRSTWGPGASENSVFRRVFADFHNFSRFDENQQKPYGKPQFSIVPGPKFHPKSAPNRSKISFRGVLGPQERPQTSRDPSQDPPRTPRDPPGPPQDPPGPPQEGPKALPGPPRTPPRTPRDPREPPGRPPGAPRDAPGSPPGALQNPPGLPRSLQDHPQTSGDLPRPLQNC